MHTIGDVASSEMIRVLEPYEWFTVTKNGQKLIEFAKEKVKHYNPRAGYGYYEFTEPGYVLSKRNIMALTKVIIEFITSIRKNFTHYNLASILERRVIHRTWCASPHWCYWGL